MKEQALAAIETDALVRSILRVPEEQCEPVWLHSGDCSSKPETRGRAVLRWFIDSFALASCGMVGIYMGVGLDEPNVSRDQTGRKNKTSPRQRGATTARNDPDGSSFD
jgi:hypothetical protein